MPELEEFTDSGRVDGLATALRGFVAEAPVALPLPYDTVRARGVVRRRRRRAAVLGAAAAVCALGVLGSGMFLPGRQQGVVPAEQPSTSTGASTLPRPPRTVGRMDLSTHMFEARIDPTTVRTFPATAGRPESPTRTGSMTVVEKTAVLRMTSSAAPSPGPGSYDLTLQWCLRLATEDGSPQYVCGLPWIGTGGVGHQNTTQGTIGLTTVDAQWLYEHVAIGDRVEVVDP